MLTLPSEETEWVVFGDSNFFFLVLNIKVHLRQRGQKGNQMVQKKVQYMLLEICR